MELLLAFMAVNIVLGLRAASGRRLPPAVVLVVAIAVMSIGYLSRRII
jgi:hypothetical protein